MNPEWTPPRELRDPYVRRLHVARTVWSRAIRGRISKLADVAVARTLADYGNKDGSRCHPGVARLAADLCSSERTVMRSLAALWEAGWISFTARGARKLGMADTYRLTVPAPVAVELGLWADDPGEDARQWMERPRNVPKRQGSTGHGRHLERPVLSDAGVTYNTVLGDKRAVLGDKRAVLGDTGVTPPGSDPGFYHPSASGEAAPRSRAGRGHRAPLFDLNADDLNEQIEDHLDALGYVPDSTLIDAMLAAGRHPNAIVNTVMAQQTGTTS